MAGTCSGKLVVHRDGQVAFCTHQLNPHGTCDLRLERHSTFLSCAGVVDSGLECPRCGPVAANAAEAVR